MPTLWWLAETIADNICRHHRCRHVYFANKKILDKYIEKKKTVSFIFFLEYLAIVICQTFALTAPKFEDCILALQIFSMRNSISRPGSHLL